MRREERELFVAFADIVSEPAASAVAPRIDAILAARPRACDLPRTGER